MDHGDKFVVRECESVEDEPCVIIEYHVGDEPGHEKDMVETLVSEVVGKPESADTLDLHIPLRAVDKLIEGLRTVADTMQKRNDQAGGTNGMQTL